MFRRNLVYKYRLQFLKNEADKFKAQKLTEQLLKRFEIPYKIVEN